MWVRNFAKYLLWSALVFVLVFALAVASLPWWGPAAFQRWVPGVLEGLGFSEAELTLGQFGLREAELNVLRMRYQGVALSDSEILLQYDWRELWGGRVEKVVVKHPVIDIDFSEGLPVSREPRAEGNRELSEAALPIDALEIVDAVLTLRAEEWSRSWELDGQFALDERLQGSVTIEGEGIRLRAEADAIWPDLTWRVKASATIDEPATWLSFAGERAWLSLPEKHSLASGPLEGEASAAFEHHELKDWEAAWSIGQIDGSVGNIRLSGRHFEMRMLGEAMQMNAGLSAGLSRRLTFSADLLDSNLTASGLGLESKDLKVSIQGALTDSLEATLGLGGGRLSWSDGAGLSQGLEGEVQLASLLPPVTDGRQRLRFASIEQGDFAMQSGRVGFSYQGGPGAENPLELECAADALGGRVRIVARGRVAAPWSLALRVFLEGVNLEKVADLFPQFDGQIEGEASGELALRLEEKRLILEPGSLQLTPDSVGRFAYTQQGWLTQDPDLNPEAFVKGRGIVNIMEDPKGASVITELAMRDLAMTEFTLKVLERDSGDERVMAQIKGHSMVKGVKVPVVLDVPIRGDVKETINAVLKLNAKR